MKIKARRKVRVERAKRESLEELLVSVEKRAEFLELELNALSLAVQKGLNSTQRALVKKLISEEIHIQKALKKAQAGNTLVNNLNNQTNKMINGDF